MNSKNDIVQLADGNKAVLLCFDPIEREWMARGMNGGIMFITEKQITKNVFPAGAMNAPE